MSSSTLKSSSPLSTSSSPVNSNYLQLPKLDLRPERYISSTNFRDQATSIRPSSLKDSKRQDSKESNKNMLPMSQKNGQKIIYSEYLKNLGSNKEEILAQLKERDKMKKKKQKIFQNRK